MTTFKFHLQSVLDYREGVEKEKRQLFLSEEENLKKIHKELATLDKELDELRTTIDTQKFTVFEYQQMIRYKDSLLIKRETLLSHLQKQEKVVYQAELNWQESKKEVLVLEKLKDKNELSFKEELERKENQELDEMATMRF